jgi:hypothetical protein
MSLINEALKKAEQARAGGLTEAPASPAVPAITKRGRAIGTRTLALLGVVVVLLVVGGTTSLFLRSDPDPVSAPRPEGVVKAKAVPAAKPAPAQTSETNSTTPTTSPRENAASSTATTAPVGSMPAPGITDHTAAPSAPTAPNVLPPTAAPARSAPPPSPPSAAPASAAPAIAPSTTVVVSTPPPAPPIASASPTVAVPPANPMPRPDEKIAEYLDRLRILGVRSPGPEARVLIGERVYRINDIVDRTHGLRLQSVEPGRITFVDPSGASYTKNY